MIGELRQKRPPIGSLIRSWERGRNDRLASRGSHPQRAGIQRKWYRLGYRFTCRQLERGEILQLRLDFESAHHADADGGLSG